MLASLRIQNVVLIDQVTIDFKGGLCALTGETGAGKSILLDSLGLALGARAESGLVRKGADQASVSASFDVPANHVSKTILKNADLAWDQNLIIRRTLTTDGRSRAFINDQPVSIGLLKEVGDSLVEIHGQFDTQGLLNPATHRAMLDDYAGVDDTLENAWASWQQKEQAVQDLKLAASASKAEEEYLRTAVEDLEALSPQAGEEQTLAGLRERLMHREQVLEALSAADQILSGDNDPVRAAWAVLDKVSAKLGEEAKDVIGALERANAEMQEAVSAIQTLSADLSESEHDLQSIDDRLYGLRAQARKHQCAVDELPAKQEELTAKLNAIEHADDLMEDAIKAAEKARGIYIAQAEKVSAQRTKAASKLDSLVAKELPPLKLEKAKFFTSIEKLQESEWGAGGFDRVRFLVATNPGANPGPLNKIASGGEMSRFMLALKVVMAEVGSAGSLIFDEVDAGIGGAVADAVGERLAKLAKGKQVLVVTHAPQVAARAGHHFIVQKAGTKDVKTNVLKLSSRTERCEEIARMLAGAVITKEARAAAGKLLETGT